MSAKQEVNKIATKISLEAAGTFVVAPEQVNRTRKLDISSILTSGLCEKIEKSNINESLFQL